MSCADVQEEGAQEAGAWCWYADSLRFTVFVSSCCNSCTYWEPNLLLAGGGRAGSGKQQQAVFSAWITLEYIPAGLDSAEDLAASPEYEVVVCLLGTAVL